MCEQTNVYANQVMLGTREEQSHPDDPKSCDMYKKSLARKRNALEDRVTISGQYPYSCDVCGKSYISLRSLIKHNYIHREPVLCEICNKTFSTKSSLRRHMRTHSGDYPYSCDICGKSFIDSHSLRIHTRRHMQDLPYSCNCCDKKFAVKSDLAMHISRIHNEKPQFACEICGNLYNQKELLSTHMNHQESTYAAPVTSRRRLGESLYVSVKFRENMSNTTTTIKS
ncbi:hypothetical protein C0J52_07335 [Blattella germanica]|nr:hypothetical protein C0J52_07335 [Blattella germanica]